MKRERGSLFIRPNTKVYEGMIIGENARAVDLDVNAIKEKKLTNMRASGSDENILLKPPRQMSLEAALEDVVPAAAALGLGQVEFREGLAEALPVEDGWADVVISNGVINLCADKRAVFAEIRRVLRPGGRLQFADIANGRPVPVEAMRDIDLWTG